jgi:hypothetical protein
MALRYCTNLTTCSAMADAFDSASHAPWTRMLPGTWSGQTRFNLALRILFSVAGGSLLLDETGVAKPDARLLGEAAGVWSSQQRPGVFGVSLVFRVWTDGQGRIPLALRRWQNAGPSQFALALAMLS